jgi:hypothetical protein
MILFFKQHKKYLLLLGICFVIAILNQWSFAEMLGRIGIASLVGYAIMYLL